MPLWQGRGCPIPVVDRNGSVRLNSAFTYAPALDSRVFKAVIYRLEAEHPTRRLFPLRW
jgi:hypothetical protein